MADKKARVQAIIAKSISEIIFSDLENPLFKLASVNGVDVTADYSFAKVYISHLQQNKNTELVIELNKAKSFIRSHLAGKLDIYKTPELIFIIDDTYDKGEKIDKIIRSLNKE